jgi:hypothetical protein
MAHTDPRQFDAASHGVFAMDSEATLRQLARHIVATQKEMAALARYADTQRAVAEDNDHLARLLAVWETFQRQWFTQRLPSLIAAMRLALEVYDTFGPGMMRLDDPIEAGIWNNKYFVWERELSPTSADIR